MRSRRGSLVYLLAVLVVVSCCGLACGAAASSSDAVRADGIDAASLDAPTTTRDDASSDAGVLSGDAAVPDDTYVAIPANPSFTFKKALSSDDAGSISIPAYAMAKVPVTNAQYQTFCQATGRTPPSGWDADGGVPSGLADHPVLQVSQADAAAYAAWLTSNSTTWTFRLPTEAEWENAARGPNDYAYPWGNDPGVSYDASTFTITTPFNFNAVATAYYLQTYGTTTTTMAIGDGGTETVVVDEILSESSSGQVTGWELDNDASGFIQTALFQQNLGTLGYTTPVGSYAAA